MVWSLSIPPCLSCPGLAISGLAQQLEMSGGGCPEEQAHQAQAQAQQLWPTWGFKSPVRYSSGTVGWDSESSTF